MKEYIGSQEHFEDEINANYDERERISKSMEQPDNRPQPEPEESQKELITKRGRIQCFKTFDHALTQEEINSITPEMQQKWADEKLQDISRKLKINADDAGNEVFDWFEWGIISDIIEGFIQRKK